MKNVAMSSFIDNCVAELDRYGRAFNIGGSYVQIQFINIRRAEVLGTTIAIVHIVERLQQFKIHAPAVEERLRGLLVLQMQTHDRVLVVDEQPDIAFVNPQLL